MRIGTDLGGKVTSGRAGRRCSPRPVEIYAALERGVIDSAEWVGPHDDMKLGLHNTARYYYYPGWHEPGTMSEFTFNRKAYEALPVELRRTLDHAAAAVQAYGLSDFHAKNALALETTPDGVQGQGRGAPAPAPGAPRSQEAGDRGRQGRVREDADGQEGARVLHEVPGAGRVPGTMSPRGAYHQLVGGVGRRDERPTQVPREGGRRDGGGRDRGHRRRAQRHRPAEGPVAHGPRLDPDARHAARSGPAAGEGRRRDERRAVPDRGLPGRPDHADCFELLRRGLQGTIEAFMGAPHYWTRQGARARVVRDDPVRHEPRGHDRVVLPGRRAQALGRSLRAVQRRAAPRAGASPRRWRDGSGRRSTRSATTRASRCGSPGLGGKVIARAGGTAVLTPAADDLRRARARRHRCRRVRRAARRHEAGAPQDRALLLLPGLARARHHDRVRLQQEGVRGAPASTCDGRSTTPPPPSRSTASRSTTRRTRSRSERLRMEFKGKVEVLQLPVPVLRDLKKLAAEVVREESEKTPNGPEGPRVLHEVPASRGPLGSRSPKAPTTSSWRGEEAREDRPTPVHRDGGRGGGRRRGGRPRRRSQRHRAAEGPVAHVDDLDLGPRHAPGRGPAAGQGRRRDERRAVPDRGLPGRPDHAAVRVLRGGLAGHHRGFMGPRTTGRTRSRRSSGLPPSRSA